MVSKVGTKLLILRNRNIVYYPMLSLSSRGTCYLPFTAITPAVVFFSADSFGREFIRLLFPRIEYFQQFIGLYQTWGLSYSLSYLARRRIKIHWRIVTKTLYITNANKNYKKYCKNTRNVLTL